MSEGDDSATPEALDVLAIFAHPDDAELLAGGALARSVERGERVGILDLTRGEMGSRGTAETRAQEAAAASLVLGIDVRRNAGLPDSALQPSIQSRMVVATLLRELRPTVVVTHWDEGRHPDHGAAAQLVVEASFVSGLKNLDCQGTPFRPRKVLHAIAFREDAPRPSFVVDVSDQIDRKIEALACYATQFRGQTGVGEVFPGGKRPFEEQVRAHLAYWGSRIRAPYGEPFWTREAMEAESLGTLGVSTF